MDDSFGPRLEGHFDFTLLFEQSIFQIAPSSIVLCALPFFIRKIVQQQVLVRPGWLLWAKIVTAVAIVAVQLATVVFWYRSAFNTTAAQAGTILSFLAAVGIVAVTYVSHSHFLQPLPFLALYLSVTFLFDLATIYTYVHRMGLETIAHLTCALPALKFVLMILEEISKRSLIVAENRDLLGNEVIAGFWSRSTFLWINPLLRFGFRHTIDNNDLPDLGHQFDSEELYENWKICWDKQGKSAKFALLWSLIYSMPGAFACVFLPRLVLSGFTFSQPFLLQDVVNATSGEDVRPDYLSKENEATALILATALVFSGKAISRAWFSHFKNQIMVRIRGALISAIFYKSLRLVAADAEDAAAITLVTADVPGIQDLISLVYDSISMVIEFGFGIAILSLLVGAASIFTVLTAIIMTVACNQIMKRIGATRKAWNEHISERVAATSNILAQIKDIKMTGLVPSMIEYLKDLRAKEILVSLRMRRVVCCLYVFSSFADTVTPALVVGATLFWTRASEPMSTARFYTILAVVALVARPIMLLFENFTSWASGFACLDRIQDYLNQEEMEDTRQVIADLTTASVTDAATMDSSNTRAPSTPTALQLVDISISVDRAGSILREASIVIKPGEMTMILGSVGCGKSTLLRAMLGEMVLKSGRALLSSRSIAFASQRPWLLNTSIRLNIIGRKPFDEALYRRVTFICELGPDFEQLPNGDETVIGSGGSMLSGGQKQRVSMARALYIEASVTILDDPFSSLDQTTSSMIRQRLVADGRAMPNGRTVIMTTSMKQHLIDADAAFRVTDEGRVVALSTDQINAERDEMTKKREKAAIPSAEESPDPVQPFEPPEVQSAPSDDGDKDEKGVQSYSSFSLYMYFLGPAGIGIAVAWFLCVAIASLSERLPNIWVRIWLTADANNNRYYIGYILLSVAHPILNGLSALFFFYFIVTKAANKLHENLVNATFQATFKFLTTEDGGALLNRFSSDLAMATQRASIQILPAVFRGITVIVDIGIISAGATYAAPVIPFFLAFVVLLQQYYLRTSRQLRILELDVAKTLIRHFTETATGIEHIRAFRWQKEMAKDLYAFLNLAQRSFYFFLCIQQWLEFALDFSSATAAVVVVTFALKYPHTATASSMGLAFLTLIGFNDMVSEWIQASVAMETAFGGVSRVRAYCEKTPREDHKHDTEPTSEEWPDKGQLELKCVSASYGAETSPQFSQVKNASVIVKPGETLGITGRTGSGKTTILLSILNLLQYDGKINIDNREIRTVSPDFLRSRITTITQGGIYLRGSVKFNLDPFHPSLRRATEIVTDEMCQDVLQRVGLWNLISSRGHLTSRMKDMNLSDGQRQLFQLARAILHHETTGSRIVLMDEATSNLDDETGDRMSEVLRAAFAGCTVVIISHRALAADVLDVVMRIHEGQAKVIKHAPSQD